MTDVAPFLRRWIERRALDELEPLRDAAGVLAVPVDVESIAARHGVIVTRVPGDFLAAIERPNLDGTPVSGMLDFANLAIWIPAAELPERQRFSIAHELGHLLLPGHRELYADGPRYTVTGPDGSPSDVDLTGDPGERAARKQAAEAEADAFAAALLMPAGAVDAAVAELGPSVPLVAERLGMSAAAMRMGMARYLPRLEWA